MILGRSTHAYRGISTIHLSLRCPRRCLHQSKQHHNEETGSPNYQNGKDVEPMEIPDAEWELRAGRAYALVKETLPSFFLTGLIERSSDDDTTPSIYSPKIQLQYTPPPTLPVPIPIPHTLHIDGLPLYHASSVFVRHSLAMFYTNLRIELRSCRVLPHDTKGGENISKIAGDSHETRSPRQERRFTVGLEVQGISRMGGGSKEWDVLATYHISPISGQIIKHVVESIQPAPHVSIYATLGAAFGKFAGFRPPEPEPVPDVRVSQVDTQPTKPAP